MAKSKDPYGRLSAQAEDLTGLGKKRQPKRQGVDAFKPKPETPRRETTRAVNYRLPVSLLEQIEAAAEREGIGPGQKTAFVVWLLRTSLNALDDGSLTLPRRDSADL